jgi:GT2 family glycosyltransferase
MQGGDLITIGILNRNGMPILKDVVEALLAQDYEPKEVVVSDNGSTDGSIEFLKGFPAVKVIENGENLGYGAGKNIAVQNSKGQYILLLDNDIILTEKNILSGLLEFYRNTKNIAFLSVPLAESGKTKTGHYGLFYTSIKKEKSIAQLQKKKYFLAGGFIGGAVFFEKDIFNALGGYDTIYPFNLDDYDLSARAYLAGKKIYILTSCPCLHAGVQQKPDLKSVCWKNQYYLCGFSRMIWKNYKLVNLVIWWPAAVLWILFKSFSKSVKHISFGPLSAYFKSFGMFFRDFGDTLKQRKKIQTARTVKNDVFLKIKPPQTE